MSSRGFKKKKIKVRKLPKSWSEFKLNDSLTTTAEEAWYRAGYEDGFSRAKAVILGSLDGRK